MMRLGHHSVASPIGLGLGWVIAITGAAPVAVGAVCAALVVWSSTANDLDHPRFKGKMAPAAALVRASGRLGYMIRTKADQQREDVHRGPSHCVEWCALLGVLVWLVTAQVPPIAPWAMWWGIAVGVGTGSHILADWPTPSGVPISAVYNYFVHGEVWKRHSLGWFSTNSGAERFWVVPIMFGVALVELLGMLGMLGPVVTLLTG